MSKNVIHNFNLSIQNSADIKSSEHLTETVIKELAKVRKEMNQQKDIVQIWQEQNNKNVTVVSDNFKALTEGGTNDAFIGAMKKPIMPVSTFGSPLFTTSITAPIEGGGSDNTGRINMDSPRSADITPSVQRVDNILNNGITSQIYPEIFVEQNPTVQENLQTNNNEPSIEVIKAEVKKKLDSAVSTKNTNAGNYWTIISNAFNEGATAKDFDGKKGHHLFTKMYFELRKWRLASISNNSFNTINWGEVSELMTLKLVALSKEEDNEKKNNVLQKVS